MSADISSTFHCPHVSPELCLKKCIKSFILHCIKIWITFSLSQMLYTPLRLRPMIRDISLGSELMSYKVMMILTSYMAIIFLSKLEKFFIILGPNYLWSSCQHLIFMLCASAKWNIFQFFEESVLKIIFQLYLSISCYQHILYSSFNSHSMLCACMLS